MIVITAHGRLAHQPEIKLLKQTSVCEFRLLSNRFCRGEEYAEAVTFFCYGEEAEAFCERVEIGQLISATGTQETARWTDGSGQERTRVKYKLTWWEAGPRPNRMRVQEGASIGRQLSAPAAPRRQGGPQAVEPARVAAFEVRQPDDQPAVSGLI